MSNSVFNYKFKCHCVSLNVSVTIRMHFNCPQLTMQLIVNKASLFTYDCDINVLKNYLEVYDIKAMCSLTMHLVPTGLLSDHADNRNGELVASYETLTLGMA